MREVEKDWITEFLYANQYSSVMNKTKWRELANEMTSNPDFYPGVRLKSLEQEAESRFSGPDWELIKYGGGARSIEWMEIDPIKRTYVGSLVKEQTADFSSWVRAALQKHSIPFSEEDGLFRINGYLKPNDQ